MSSLDELREELRYQIKRLEERIERLEDAVLAIKREM